MSLDTTLNRETPEGVELGLKVAGPVPRAMAWLIDGLIQIALIWGIVMVTSLLGEFGFGVLLITLFVIEWFYPVVFEMFRDGATPGKSVFGLRVIADDGSPLSWHASMTRNLLRTIDMLPLLYLVGLISMLCNRDFKRLGDLAAGTIVVYSERHRGRLKIPEAQALPLKHSLSAEEQLAIIDYARAMPRLSHSRAQELASLLKSMQNNGDQTSPHELLAYANWITGNHETSRV